MLAKAEKAPLPVYPVDAEHMQTLVPRYTACLASLKETLAKEKAGHLGLTTGVSLKRKLHDDTDDKDNDQAMADDDDDEDDAKRDDEAGAKDDDDDVAPREALRARLVEHLKRQRATE
ncbi:hypothetical protein SPRG_16620 [Saprolegnia parasitica CBS 223.65]|uniref:Uncharacterized protein n=1 Tax=Saprolegnia parasitica (strain CBS 223.65) TaxID=695850 RepID=A0A067BUL7_SAPPC|nr:hypothetical protein SPRG_16620 [Saprolegnia parasitica CBS 223.65]KDO17986.1 hypothetical protein SPRG_16620 [Saprolegnia parasitica CBS 223.65]|eukprot:XP_012211315.1 hypothetical protein SPRG_16620 [Saprolegnia parasitica CBS 223.65]